MAPIDNQQQAADAPEGGESQHDAFDPLGPSEGRPLPTHGPAGAQSAMPSAVGKYRVTKWLGSGGMGEVWLAEDEFGNEVAVKLFTATGPSRESFLRMFMREARTLSMLQHRNICRIYGIEEHDGRPFIIMEYVRGIDLSTILKHLAHTAVRHGDTRSHAADLRSVIGEVEEQLRRRDTLLPESRVVETKGHTRTLPLQQALHIVIKLCDAIQYAHERGVFHRDIKPSNIVVRPDGEPVLLDFGVAKSTGVSSMKESFTQTGQILGTIDYMAPEQEQSSKRIDERADVYSIGVVLYELVTGRKYFQSTGELLHDLERLRDYHPVKSFFTTHVERELQAIIMKAVAPEKEQRYRSARSLAQDLTRFLDGQPVVARPPTPWYLASKFVRRNAVGVALSSIIALLMVTLGGYYAVDYYRAWGNWLPAFEHDFVARQRLGGQFEFVDSSGQASPAWVVDSAGLLLPQFNWCWLRDIRLSGNVRVVMRVRFEQMPDGFEVAINAARDTLSQWYEVPRGYSCQVGGYQGTLDFISVNKTPTVARTANPVPSRVDPDRDVEIVFQREGERVSLEVNGRRQVEERDVSPMWGPDFARVGFRSFAARTRVRSIKVFRMSLPQKASPLIAGDVLASAGYSRDAIRMYLTIGDDYPGTALAQKAIVRSLHTVYQLSEPFKSHLADSVMGIYGEDVRGTGVWQDVREMQMLDLWKRGQFDAVMKMLSEHYGAYPNSQIAIELQAVSPRTPPDSVSYALFMRAARIPGIRCLTATNMPASALALLDGLPLGYLRWPVGELSDLTPLSRSRLTWLVISSNRVSDISPLWGQPLSHLNIASNRVAALDGLVNAPLRILFAANNHLSRIDPIRYCPLEAVSLFGNRISDISALAGKRLRTVDISDNQVRSLAPLEGTPLGQLVANGNLIESVAPLRRSPLRDLRCSWNGVSELVALTGSSIERLEINYNRIESIAPLENLPLRELYCSNNRITDISPLQGTALRRLDIRGNQIRDVAALAGMPLEHLDCSDNQITDFSPITRLNLRSLACGGNGKIPLAALRQMPLQALDCANSGLDDLWVLNGQKLTQLVCARNRIKELGPVVGMPLQSLNCNDNQIESLAPLAGTGLRILECARNRITSLEPLRGLTLTQLDCRDNPIRSLAPLLSSPPPQFLFFSRTIPVSELEKAAAVWDADTLYRVHARHARILAHINAGRPELLRNLAVRNGNKSYVLVPWELRRTEAAELCERSGGTFLQIKSDDEWFYLRDELNFGTYNAVWAGVSTKDEKPVWEYGEGAPQAFMVHDSKGEWTYSHGALRKINVERAVFVIEFEAL